MSHLYLIHFSTPICHARHYLGCTNNLIQRLRQHRAGQGANLTKVAVERGIVLTVAAVWHTTDNEWTAERAAKSQKRAPRFCPICTSYPVSPSRCQRLPDDFTSTL